MPTVVTSAGPYCTPARLVGFKDWRVLADWSKDSWGPAPTYRALLDPEDPAGATVAQALASASGEVESCCLKGGRYTPADLAALTGNTRADLESLVGWLAVGVLAGRRSTAEAAKIGEVAEARRKLQSLRLGEAVFGLQAPIDAGKGTEVVRTDLPTANTTPTTVTRASAFFGRRGNCY